MLNLKVDCNFEMNYLDLELLFAQIWILSLEGGVYCFFRYLHGNYNLFNDLIGHKLMLFHLSYAGDWLFFYMVWMNTGL